MLTREQRITLDAIKNRVSSLTLLYREGIDKVMVDLSKFVDENLDIAPGLIPEYIYDKEITKLFKLKEG